MLGLAADNGDPSAEDAVLRVGNRVAAVVAYYPPVDLRPLARGVSAENANVRFPALNFDPSEASAISPIVHVSGDDPPTLLMHGDSDGLVPVSNSHEMYAALQEKGVESKVIIIPGADHGFRGDDADLAMTALVDWFEAHLSARSSN
jgi:dipeptidyl aminopeptidase/acylaminoacyl peptidase